MPSQKIIIDTDPVSGILTTIYTEAQIYISPPSHFTPLNQDANHVNTTNRVSMISSPFYWPFRPSPKNSKFSSSP